MLHIHLSTTLLLLHPTLLSFIDLFYFYPQFNLSLYFNLYTFIYSLSVLLDYIMRKACCEQDNMNNKGAWSKQEDQKLIDYIRKHGQGSWRTLPNSAGLLRCGKSCRLRWINYLRPDLKRGGFSEDEQDLIIRLHALLGNRWSLIAGRLPGRTDNEVKNYWNSHLRKKLVKMGIDPRNHRLGHGNLPFFTEAQRSTVVSSTSSSSALNPTIPAARTGSNNEKEKNDGRNPKLKDVNVVQSRDASPQLNLDLTITLPSNPKLSGDHLETANYKHTYI